MGNKIGKLRHKTPVSQSLTENEINLLIASTNMDRDQILDFHVNFLQDCPSGVVTKKEFVKMFKQLHSNDTQKQKAEKFTEYVFNALADSQSNTIQFTDFVVCFSITSFGNLKEKITLAFHIYDINKNNVLEAHEMLKVLEALFELTGTYEDDTFRKNHKSVKAFIESIIKKYDKNENQVLELDEFLESCLQDETLRKILIDPLFNC